MKYKQESQWLSKRKKTLRFTNDTALLIGKRRIHANTTQQNGWKIDILENYEMVLNCLDSEITYDG